MKSSFTVLLIGTGAAQVIGVLAVIALARVYDPIAFGYFQAHFSLFMLFILVSSLRYDLAILVESDEQNLAPLLALCAVSCTVVAIFVAGLATLLDHYDFGPFRNAPFLWWSLPCAIIVGGAYQCLSMNMTREKRFGWIATGRVCQTVTFAIAAVLMGLASKPMPIGLVVADLISRGISALVFATAWFSLKSGGLLPVPLSKLSMLAASHKKFPVYNAPGALLNATAGTMTPLIIFSVFGSSAAGFYALVDRVVLAPFALLAMTATQVITGEFSAIARERKTGLQRLFRRVVAIGLCLVIGPTAIIVFFAEPTFVLLFGEEWREAGRLGAAAAPLLLAVGMVAPVTNLLVVYERQGLQFAWETGRLIMIAFYWAFAIITDLPLVTAVAIWALISFSSHMVYLLLADNVAVRWDARMEAVKP